MTPILITIFLIIALYLITRKRNPTLEVIPSNSFLVDVRTPDEFKSGSVPNAVNIPLSEIEKSLDQFTNKENIIVFL